MAGYSNRSLIDKLGIKEGFRIALVNAPRGYKGALGRLPKKVSMAGTDGPHSGGLDFIQVFGSERSDVEKKIVTLKKKLLPQGMLWVSWPKASSGVETDVNENVVREMALKHGLVDVKVCAVDEIWSGLKLVYRLKDRPAKSAPPTNSQAARARYPS